MDTQSEATTQKGSRWTAWPAVVLRLVLLLPFSLWSVFTLYASLLEVIARAWNLGALGMFYFLAALLWLAFGIFCIWLCLRGWRSTYRVALGLQSISAKALLGQYVAASLLVGLLLLIAIPKVADVRRYEAQAVTRGELTAVRRSLEIENKSRGRYPLQLEDMAWHGDQYFKEFPKLWDEKFVAFPHPATARAVTFSSRTVTDSGRWAYVHDPSIPDRAEVFIDCTHLDSEGRAWTSF